MGTLHMKRVGNLKEKIIDLDNIALAAYKTFRRHRRQKEVVAFCGDFQNNITRIREALDKGTMEIGKYSYFKIRDPKERLICAARLEERIVHHAIMNVCDEAFERKQIYDSYASRKGKGVYAALERVKSRLRQYPYFAKLDIRKYFDNIDHEILLGMLHNMIKDRWLMNLLERIIHSYNTLPGKGIPIGNLTSQYFANLYMCGLDHYMKEYGGVPLYVRYMDDVVILEKSRSEVRRHAECFTIYAENNLKLKVKPPVIGDGKSGVPFLGYKVGVYDMRLSGRSKRRFRHKLNLYGNLYADDYISEKCYSDRVTQLCAFTLHSDSFGFRRKCMGESIVYG